MSSRPLLATAPHELDAHLIYGNAPGRDGHGLAPYFAFLSLIREHGGSVRYSLEFQGHDVSGHLYYQESGIEEIRHPSADGLGRIIEPRISWSVDDESDVAERSGGFHIAPRASDMRKSDGSRIDVPEDLLGVDVRAQGSNLEPALYPDLFRAIAVELGVSGRYFEELHPYSNVSDLARYVRVERGASGPVHAVDGVISRMANLLANDREGYRKHVADDTEAPGFYHSATVGSKRAAELVEGHRFAKELKHYLPRHPGAFDEDEPLYHPKVEVSFQVRRDADGAVPWADLEQLDRELDEALLNALAWTGFSIEADVDAETVDGPYVADAYFSPEAKFRPRTLTDDPLPSLEARQESYIVKHLVDGLEESDLALVGQLVADGGHHSPADVAEETGFHLSTIYRAMKRVEGLVEHSYGDVALRSPYIAERLVEAVQDAEATLASTIEVGANALAFAAEDLESSSLVKWLRAHNADLLDEADGLTIRLGKAPGLSIGDVRAALRKGLLRWKHAGRDPGRFRSATVVYTREGQTNVLAEALPRGVG